MAKSKILRNAKMALIALLALPVLAFYVFLVGYVVGLYQEQSEIAKLDRLNTDWRNISENLEDYRTEHGIYPEELWNMTTPVPFYFFDSFLADESDMYRYKRFTGQSYMLVSVGPNQIPDIDFDTDVPTTVSIQRLDRLMKKTYLTRYAQWPRFNKNRKKGDLWRIRLPNDGGVFSMNEIWQIESVFLSEDSFTTATKK